MALSYVDALKSIVGEEAVESFIQDVANANLKKSSKTPKSSSPKQEDITELTLPKIWTAQELSETDFPEPQWLVPGILPEGGLILLAGKPKIGKSWLCLDIACGLTAGEPVCGVPAERQARALYLALEDPARRLKNRMEVAGYPISETLMATTWPKGEEGLQLLAQTVLKHKISLVVLDTLAKFRVHQPGIPQYQQDYEALGGLKNLADRLGITVLVVHHLRKTGSEDILEEISGTTGLTGAADSILVLKRGRGEADGTLYLIGRDIEESELALRFDNGRWVVLGEAHEYAITQERRQVLEILKAAGEPLSPKDIASEIGKSETSVKILLGRMVEAGLIKKASRGKYTTTVTTVTNITSVTPVTTVTSGQVTPSNRVGVTLRSLDNPCFEGKSNRVTEVTCNEQLPSSRGNISDHFLPRVERWTEN